MLLLLEALKRRRSSGSGWGQEVHRVSPAVWEALTEETWLQLQLLPQEADGHLQDVSFLQLRVRLLLVELLLQDDLKLIDAVVDAIPSHFLHRGFSQLQRENTLALIISENKALLLRPRHWRHLCLLIDSAAAGYSPWGCLSLTSWGGDRRGSCWSREPCLCGIRRVCVRGLLP